MNTDENNRTAVKTIKRKNIVNVAESNKNNHSGYIHFSMDIFGDTYTKIDKTNSTEKEDTSKIELKNVLTQEKYYNIVSLLAEKSIIVDLVVPCNDIKIGDMISLDINKMLGDETKTLKISDNYIVHSIIHEITVNMTYDQSLVLIKK
jgi:hypothetical protein